MSLSSFEKIAKRCLAHLPKDDYPALDTRKFVSTWISFVLDQSQTSMRSMIQRLNIGKINVNLSTFSKASKNRGSLGIMVINLTNHRMRREALYVDGQNW